MRRISVGLVLRVGDDVAADHESLIAYIENHLFDSGLIGNIVSTEDITKQVEARIEEMRRKRA
jgi:hypothetical protein